MPLSDAAIKRIANKAGIKRVRSTTYAKTNRLYDHMLKKVVHKALKYTKNTDRKTVKIGDVQLAIGSLKYDMFKLKPKFKFSKTRFRNDVKKIEDMRISDNALEKLMAFMSNYLLEHIKSANTAVNCHSAEFTRCKSRTPSPPPLTQHQMSFSERFDATPSTVGDFSLSLPEMSLSSQSEDFQGAQSQYSFPPLSQSPPLKKKKKKRPKLKRSNANARSLHSSS